MKRRRDGSWPPPESEARSTRPRYDDDPRGGRDSPRHTRSPEPARHRPRHDESGRTRERHATRQFDASSHHHSHSRHHHHHHHRSRTTQSRRDEGSSSKPACACPAQLPFSARSLTKSDLDNFRPLLARYLDIQKGKFLKDMNEREIRGRWKSFMAKWNEGSLAEGWYSPELVEQTLWQGIEPRGAREEEEEESSVPPPTSEKTLEARDEAKAQADFARRGLEDVDDEDDDYGPVLPGPSARTGTARHGPGIPSLQDLEVQREVAEEDRLDSLAQLRLERKADRAEQKVRLEELVPRAEAGTRERKLEKKKELNDKMKGFRERSPGAAEVNDSELMGGGDSVAEYKQQKAAAERRKTEREIRREEIQRAKEAEREERLERYKAREDKAMVMLKELAKQRFG
jgi:hypothetical protein